MIDIFCTKDSLEFIFNEYCRLRSPERILEDNDGSSQTFEGLYDVIVSKANLVIDISLEELIELSKSNLFFKHLVKRSQRGGSKICDQGFHETILNNQFNDFPRAVFLLDISEKECKELEEKFGLLFLCKNNLLRKSKFLFASEVIPIGDKSKKEITISTWAEFEKFKHPFNSLIIIDNYFWKDESDLSSLMPLLKSLLPDQLSDQKTDFHLTLITYDAEIKTEQFNEARRKELQEKINDQLNRPFRIKTSIIKHNVLDKNHDRNILTNYVWFHSGHSFDYFKEIENKYSKGLSKTETKRTTTLFINGIAHNSISFNSSKSWVVDGYDQVLGRAKNWYGEKLKSTNCNRLLE